MLDLSAKLSIT